jgi:hypothetical protein
VSAFVQVNLDFWAAWETGELSNEERDLGLYIAFKTDFRTGLLRTTLETIASDLGWHDPKRTTTARRLHRLAELGFVQAEVKGRGKARFHVLWPANTLLRTGHLAQQSAAKHAANESALGAGLEAKRAANNAAVEEKRREETLSRRPELQDVAGRAGETTNGKHEEQAASNGNGRHGSSGPQRIDDDVRAFMLAHDMSPPPSAAVPTTSDDDIDFESVQA